MKKIVLIATYFGNRLQNGTWPIWFDTYLFGCKANPGIDWLFFSDIEPPKHAPQNVRFVYATKPDIEKMYRDKIKPDFDLKDGYKLSSIRCSFGYVFSEYIAGYDFWGICDVDIVWGNIRKFITDDLLQNYEIISSRKDYISAHFTLFANTPKVNSLFKIGFDTPEYKEKFFNPKYCRFDEDDFTKIVRNEVNNNKVKVLWDKYFVNTEGRELFSDSHQEFHIDKWLFENGSLYDLGKNRNERTEHMYLHFINWKRSLKTVEFNPETDTSFFVSYNGITRNKQSDFVRRMTDFRNVFWGYYVREKTRIRRKKLDKLVFKVKRKLKG